MKNIAIIQEEIEVLQSIYPEEIQEIYPHDQEYRLIYRNEKEKLLIQIEMNEEYPNELTSLALQIISHDYRRKDLEKKSLQILAESFGEVCIYKIIEEIRSSLQEEGEEPPHATFTATEGTEDSLSKSVSAEAEKEEEEQEENGEFEEKICSHQILEKEQSSSLNIIHGPITTEMKSSFQSHFAEVHCMEDVLTFRSTVTSNKKVARATHNIFAYRFLDVKTNIAHHDCDDDGETAAGARLAEMMRLMGVQNVAVIVSRWFGGVLLGPDRFKYICNSAKDLLEESGYGDHRKCPVESSNLRNDNNNGGKHSSRKKS